MSVVRVRFAEPKDAEVLAAIYVAAARHAWSHIFGTANLAGLEPPVDRFLARIGSGEAREHVLVAELDGRVGAFAIVRPSLDDDSDPRRIGELDAIYTDPSSSGLGLGRALLASAAGVLRRGGYAEATLWTAEGNLRPRRVYERAGWRPDGVTRQRVWRGVQFEELRYRISLQRT